MIIVFIVLTILMWHAALIARKESKGVVPWLIMTCAVVMTLLTALLGMFTYY